MNYPDRDSLDTMLDQALQSASHSLEGETFRIELTARIATQRHRTMLLRMLPAGMGMLAAVIVLLVARPSFDFQGGISSLANLWGNGRPAFAWLTQPLLGAQDFLLPWVLLAGMALIFGNWLANRESAVFRP